MDFANTEFGFISFSCYFSQDGTYCSDTDFNTALELVKILIPHSAKVFDTLPPETTPPPQPTKSNYFSKHCRPNFRGMTTLHSQTFGNPRQNRRKTY
jgi:hypothetical protein